MPSQTRVRRVAVDERRDLRAALRAGRQVRLDGDTPAPRRYRRGRSARAARAARASSCELLSQLRACAHHPCLHRARRDAEQAAGLAARQAVQDGRLHDRAQLRRQPPQRAAEVAVLDAEQDLLLGRRGGRRPPPRGPRRAAGGAARRSGGGSRCPRSRRRRRPARVAAGAAPDRHERVLDRLVDDARDRRSGARVAAPATARGGRTGRAAPAGRRRRPRPGSRRRCALRSRAPHALPVGRASLVRFTGTGANRSAGRLRFV